MKRWYILICLLLLSGCSAEPPATKYRVVTQIEVTVSHDSQVYKRTYSTEPQLRSILNYLRTLRTYAPVPIAPDTFRSDAFRIILRRSDGSEVCYHQISDGFLQKDGGPWEKTDSHRAAALLRLLQTLDAS